ncbi:MAG: hypothetical protein KDA59_23120, partial [Planctomycetales bacterium]|nr:hypothetical protein [Planctomycetales bacterium]
EYARQGKDWEVELRQRAKEKQLMAELGLTEEPQPVIDPEDEVNVHQPDSEEADTDVATRQAA